MSNLKIKFTGFKDLLTHVEYSIQIDDICGSQTCSLFCRYSYLRSLHTSLKKFSPSIKFPGKKIFGNKNLSFLEKRKKDLEMYFSQVFQDVKLVKVLQDLKFFQFRKVDLGVRENEKVDVSFCKDCTDAKCWDIVGMTGERFVNLSFHPGSMDDYDILDHQEIFAEKCKDLKIPINQKQWAETVPEGFQEGIQSNNWISSIFESCIFDLNQSACKLNG
ncbi:hypothetical protein SteCoe_5336 [Stentor coeruleus]|uniref:PX domain-containing protein n=1 Tax=Stentor coeruleus TaxID=5963 RepID=A0A1R2CSR4_9CILI|nr:hypothetical protein SteCoe_5336 [Stentor coeruleus]